MTNASCMLQFLTKSYFFALIELHQQHV